MLFVHHSKTLIDFTHVANAKRSVHVQQTPGYRRKLLTATAAGGVKQATQKRRTRCTLLLQSLPIQRFRQCSAPTYSSPLSPSHFVFTPGARQPPTHYQPLRLSRQLYHSVSYALPCCCYRRNLVPPQTYSCSIRQYCRWGCCCCCCRDGE